MSDNDSITETINFIDGNRTITTANGFGSSINNNNNNIINNMRLTLPNLIQPHNQNQQEKEENNSYIDEQMSKNNKQNQFNKIYQRKIQSSPAKQRRFSHEVSTLSGTTKKILNVSKKLVLYSITTVLSFFAIRKKRIPLIYLMYLSLNYIAFKIKLHFVHLRHKNCLLILNLIYKETNNNVFLKW